MGKLNSAGMLIFYSLNLDVNALFFFSFRYVSIFASDLFLKKIVFRINQSNCNYICY